VGHPKDGRSRSGPRPACHNAGMVETTGGTTFDVVEQGVGELVVFVHGVLDRGKSFDRVAALLGEECRMIWYDRRGYATSVDAVSTPVGVDQHVADLLGVLDGRPAVVVGHSFGGVSALGAAIQAPDLVRAVVTYETGLAWLPSWEDNSLAAVLWSAHPEESAVQMAYRDRWQVMSPEQRALILLEARAFVAEERSVRTGEVPFDLSELRSPLVFGYGDVYPLNMVRDHLVRTLDRLEIVELAGAGHNAHRTCPNRFAELVRRGLAWAS
jgi:pimeloyl-ACP methyl ester carboxylesterase